MGIVTAIEAAAKALPKDPPALGVGRAFDQAASKAFREASADPTKQPDPGPEPPAVTTIKPPVAVQKDPTRAGLANKLRY